MGSARAVSIFAISAARRATSFSAASDFFFSGASSLRLPAFDVRATWLLYAAAFVSLWGTAVTFYRGRHYYLEEPKAKVSSLSDD